MSGFPGGIAPVLLVAVLLSIGGWIFTTWLRVKHGYPLEGSWGQKFEPSNGGQTAERVRMIGQENAQLRAEVASLKDRMQVLERIATDSGRQLAIEIDDLRTAPASGKPVN